MPNPFPGMNPYLEERGSWPDVHAALISYSREFLQPLIQPNYVARVGERVQLATYDDAYIPDVMLVQSVKESSVTYGGTMVADVPATFTYLDEERRVPYIEIISRKTRNVITVIEVLSPTNKMGRGRNQYLEKQNDLLNSKANLVEIDLLGYGYDTVVARQFAIFEPHDWRYMISISRSNARHKVEVYAIPLRDRLPRCGIPLMPPDADVVLDLPSVFNRCYDVGGSDLLIDYNDPVPVALSDREAEWVEQLLTEKGLRSVKPEAEAP